MGKQMFGSIKNALAILLVVLFVLSITSAAIDAKTDVSNSEQKDVTKTISVVDNTTALSCDAAHPTCTLQYIGAGNNTTA